MDSANIIGATGQAALYAVAPFACVALVLGIIRIYTTWSYYQSLKQYIEQPQAGKRTVDPPQIPYSLPWLGNTLSFLAPYPGQFWEKLFSWHNRSTGICTLLIGGRKTHILFSPPAVQALFKARAPSRDIFDRELFDKVLGLPADQIHIAEGSKQIEIEANSQYLTKHERVNELTAHFCRVLEEVLDRDAQDIAKLGEIGLYKWLRNRMFTASNTALFGDKLLQMYPTYCEDFYRFDSDFMSFFFGFPKFIMGDAFERRRRIFDNLERWSKEMRRLSGGTPVDPEGPAWEPIFGMRLNRARQIGYEARNLTPRTGAAFDLGITFALSSNVIPITGWMLMHILDSNADATILPRVLVELRRAEKEDGSLDIPTLVSQPLLQSIWSETLRLYTDVLVSRSLPEDLTLPLDEDGKRQVTLSKGDTVFAPSWLGHHDASAWSGVAPYGQFHAERFLTKDPETGKETFTMNGTVGKFFPFGGGRTICE